MGISRTITLTLSVSTLALAAVIALPHSSAEAKMKAKYYKECYAQVEQAREMIPEPKTDVAGTASKFGSAAGALGKIGGFGGFGGLGKVAQTAATVQQYSGYVASAAALTEKMQSSYPDPADRILAYGEQLGDDANKIQTGAEGIEEAQQCYDDAYTQLVTDFESGAVKKKNAKKMHKEIQKGMIEISMVLSDAQQVMDSNLQNYNEALTTETTGMGLNLGDLTQAASLAKGVAGATGGGLGLNSDAVIYSRAQNLDPKSRAVLLQSAAYRARGLGSLQAAQGGALATQAAASPASFGIMNDFAMMGRMGSMGSLGSSALVSAGSQATVGSLQSAINNRNDQKPEAVPVQQVQQAQPIETQVTPQMMASLQAAGVSSEKFMESYGQVALTSERQFQVASKVGQKAGW